MVTPIRPSKSRIPFGIYHQLYRGAMRGGSDELKRYLDRIKARGENATLHGFPRDLERNVLRLVKMCDDAGLGASLAWGLDGSKDEDGTPLTATEKGTAIGNALETRGVLFGLRDAEGQWDSKIGPMDDMDEGGALDLGNATHAVATDAIIGDQPWPWILSHGGIRKTCKPIASGGVFNGFPVDEFGSTNTAGNFIQLYWLDWGPDAYLFVADRSDHDWAATNAALHSAGIDVPLGVTLQGRGHAKNPHHLAHAVIRYGYSPGMPVFFWEEPCADATTESVLSGLAILDAHGFLPIGCDPRDAVRAWQRDFNSRAQINNALVVDGWLGATSLRALGVWPS